MATIGGDAVDVVNLTPTGSTPSSGPGTGPGGTGVEWLTNPYSLAFMREAAMVAIVVGVVAPMVGSGWRSAGSAVSATR